MIRLCLLPLILISSLAGAADVESIQAEIDQTVWKPFKDAFENLDGEALNAIYAEEVLRVSPEAGMDTSSLFKQANRSRFDANIANGDYLK